MKDRTRPWAIGVFVNPEYRRQGIGTQLVERLGGIDSQTSYYPGIKGSDLFYYRLEQDFNASEVS
jgi:GNAT superfamily N-acetyltransferase